MNVRRFNVNYHAFWDTKSMIIHFFEATSGVIADSCEIAPGIVADVNESKQLVGLDLYGVPLGSMYHFYDTDQWVGDKQPLAITWDFDPASGDLFVYLTGGKAVGQLVPTEDPRLFMGTTDEGLVQGYG